MLNFRETVGVSEYVSKPTTTFNAPLCANHSTRHNQSSHAFPKNIILVHIGIKLLGAIDDGFGFTDNEIHFIWATLELACCVSGVDGSRRGYHDTFKFVFSSQFPTTRSDVKRIRIYERILHYKYNNIINQLSYTHSRVSRA